MAAGIKFKKIKDAEGRYSVIVAGKEIGVVYQEGRVWNYEGNPYPNARFWKRIQAANKLVERRQALAGLRSRIAALNGGPVSAG